MSNAQDNLGCPTNTKLKKFKSKSKALRRKRRINSEKHIQERDDEIPWPLPDESSIYKQLIVKLKNLELDAPNFLPNETLKKKSNIPNDKDMNRVQNKLELSNIADSVHESVSSSFRNKLTFVQNVNSNVATPALNASIIQSGNQEVHTLFASPCSRSSCHMNSAVSSLPPIGVFWDIENCSVPKGRSALIAVQRIRDKFFPGHYEAEFVCVCDIRKESPNVIQELNDAQITVVHVSGNSKNAADDKLRQSMRRFSDIYAGHRGGSSTSQHPATVVLISGDINFSSDLSDLRYRKQMYIILLHNKHAPEALLVCSHEKYDFHSILTDLPLRPVYKEIENYSSQLPLKGCLNAMDVLVCDLPETGNSGKKNVGAIRNRLKKLSDNCGGKIITVQGQFAIVRFPNKEAALRASKRMNGEDILGSKIRVIYSSQMEFNSQVTTTPASTTQRSLPSNASNIPSTNHGNSSVTSFRLGLKDPSPEHFDLHVTNIDPNLGDWKAIRNTLIAAFNEHVSVKGVWVYVSHDVSVNAVVRVNNKDEAHYAVAQLHRKKFGNKRIMISFEKGNNVDHESLKKEVAAVLQDVPGTSLPLFKFREMFEKRYRKSVSASDLYRLKDVVNISDTNVAKGNCALGNSVGRTISLSCEWKNKAENRVLFSCPQHPPKPDKADKICWAEKEADVMLPNVIIELKVLTSRVHALLNTHNGNLNLNNFLDCYESEFGKIEFVDPGQGVKLEHLLSCIQNVELKSDDNGMKILRWCEKKESELNIHNQPLARQLSQFAREMIDLLKTFPRCSLPFSKLIPAYHHHFGRQCRVADYGHFNLLSLLETIPHVVQIMGASPNKILTLSHRAQIKRFATDALHVINNKGGVKKQIKVSEFGQAYSQVFLQKQFNPEDYGLCYFSDLISELVANHMTVALVKDEHGNQMLIKPKREQTPQEIHRTRMFASEVVELFKHSIRYEMPFSKFVPAYHIHFGKQCRVGEYGFTKLAELLEAISDTVTCVPHSPTGEFSLDDRIIRLTPREQLKVVGEQLAKLVQHQNDAGNPVTIEDLENLFIDEHGFQLKPEMCDAIDLHDLVMNKLRSYISVRDGYVYAVDPNEMKTLISDVSSVLEKSDNYTMNIEEFISTMKKDHDVDIDLGYIENALSNVLMLCDDDNTTGKAAKVSLSPLRIFGLEMSKVVEDSGGSILLSGLEPAYLQKYNKPLRPAQFGYPSLLALLQSIPEFVQIRGKNRSKRVCLSGTDTSDSSSLEDSFRSHKHRHETPVVSNRGSSRSSHYTDTCCRTNHSKFDSGRWSDSPRHRKGLQTGSVYTSGNGGAFGGGRSQSDGTLFGYDRAPPISPPIYDMWVGDGLSPGSPPISPPVFWTYHPIVYPNTPPAESGNMMVSPHFQFTAPWSPPMASGCFERLPAQIPVVGNEYHYDQSRMVPGMERLP